MEHVIFEQMKKFLNQLIVCPMVLYHDSAIETVLKVLESPLEKKRKVLTPANGRRVIYFIDDLTMCNKEQRQESHEEESCGSPPSVLELIRQHLDHKQWYDM